MADKEPKPPNIHAGMVICERYRIEEQIARGGMATIYLAEDQQAGEPVAIKVLYPQYKDNDVVRARFLDEGRIQGMLDHPNVVRVQDVLTRPVLSFVMEYVDGETLEQYLQREGPLEQNEIVDLMMPVMSAIGFAHNKGIVHRDLKPSNILLKQHDDGLEPKVMDFGVAKVHQGQELTQDGTTVGTLHYMSPEQIVGSSDIDGRADIYSLGCSLYKLCTGEVPFNASSEFALMMAQVEASPTPPSQLHDQVSDEMETLILKALEKQRERRFQTIKEMTSQLIRLRDDEQSPDQTVSRPIPADLLRWAMEADEVVLDKTNEIRLVPTTDDSDTVDIDANDISTATRTMELESSAIRRIKADRERARRRKDGKTRAMPRFHDSGDSLEQTSESTIEDSIVSSRLDRLAGGTEPHPDDADMPTTAEQRSPVFGATEPTVEHPRPTALADGDDSDAEGVIAVDNPDVDSQEVTDLHRRNQLRGGPTRKTPRPEHVANTSESESTDSDFRNSPSDLDATDKQRPSALRKSHSTARQRPSALRDSPGSRSPSSSGSAASRSSLDDSKPATIDSPPNPDDSAPSFDQLPQPQPRGDRSEPDHSNPADPGFNTTPQPSRTPNPRRIGWIVAVAGVVLLVIVALVFWVLV